MQVKFQDAWTDAMKGFPRIVYTWNGTSVEWYQQPLFAVMEQVSLNATQIRCGLGVIFPTTLVPFLSRAYFALLLSTCWL